MVAQLNCGSEPARDQSQTPRLSRLHALPLTFFASKLAPTMRPRVEYLSFVLENRLEIRWQMKQIVYFNWQT